MSDYHAVSASFHGTKHIKAHAGGTSGAPISIEATTADGTRVGEVTFFLDDYALANRLANAINAACQPAKIEEAA